MQRIVYRSIFIFEGLDFRKRREAYRKTKNGQQATDTGIRKNNPSDQSIEYFVFLNSIHVLNTLKQGIVTRPEDGCGKQERCYNAHCVAADTHDTDSLSCPVFLLREW